MRFILVTFICFSSTLLMGQSLHHQMISSLGGHSSSSSGLIVKYSVGQQSVTGTTVGEITLQQGFQQSNWNKIIKKNNVVSVITTVFPNPFLDNVQFSFTGLKMHSELISIHIFDVLGKLVFTKDLQLIDRSVSVDLQHLPSAEYLVQLSNSSFSFHTILIKK